MAILKFDPAAHPLPDYPNLSLRDPSEPRINELEALLDPTEVAILETLRQKSDVLSEKKREEVHNKGKASQQTITDANAADEAYYSTLQQFFDRYPKLSATISRKNFDVSPPPPPPGKRNLGNPFPVHTAAMDMLWPGFYPDHYSFLKQHGANYHFPETIASLGAVFVSPPNVSVERNRRLLNHLQTIAHPQWRTAPIVTLETTRRSLMKVLAHYENDYVAVVKDSKGDIVGTVGHKEAHNAKDDQKVSKFFTRLNQSSLMDTNLGAQEGFALMKKSVNEEPRRDQLIAIGEDGVPRIMTKTTAALSNLMKPFKYKQGLGAMITVGISKNSNPIGYLRELVQDTDYDLESGNTPFAGVLIDTALCARRDVYKIIAEIREELPNTYLMAGTTTTPKATKELLRYVDAVKVGIAEGGHCKTAKTGTRIPNAWAAIDCGAEAEGKGQIASDGLHETEEFCIGMATKNVCAKIGGGSLLARNESAMPFELHGGEPNKKGRGMAAASTEEDRRGQRDLTEDEEWEEEVGIHGEGEERFNPLRDPPTVGRFLWKLKAHLRSEGRYADADTIEQLQERATFDYINGKNGS